MCGRYKQKSSAMRLRETFVIDVPDSFIAKNIVTPGTKAPVIRFAGEGPLLDVLRWGLHPQWKKEKSGAGFINARCETIAEKPSFQESFQHRRCLVPADSFFEIDPASTPRRGYDIAFPDEKPFAFAAIWDNWLHPVDQTPQSGFCLITMPACASVSPLHDRMPVILSSAEEYRTWLSPETSLQALHQCFNNYEKLNLVLEPVMPLQTANASAQMSLF